eukprot:c23672_g1_i1 orf=465-995(-)
MARLLPLEASVRFPTPPSLFKGFSGLVSAKFASPTFTISPTFSGLPMPSLRIEAGKPTRREEVRIRHRRIRKKLSGTLERPRLAVFRSNHHLYAQVIDDTQGCTIASASTIQKKLREELQLTSGPTIVAAKRVGEEIARACLQKGIAKVAFDRGGFLYHGRIQALADAARENGLDF